MSDFVPELNRIRVDSPTEDGKIAYVMNTMVPRRLEQFDDIRNDLAKRDFNTDKTYFYVNFQAGDFCGRSYKLPLSELNEFVTKSLLFGTGGKEPVIKFDENFYINEDNEIHLIITSTTPTSTQITLKEYLEQLVSKNEEQDEALQAESFVRERDDKELELKKEDKFVVRGDGDRLNSEGLPEPAEGTSGYGVHATYTKNAGPVIDKDGNRGYEILISHDAVVPAGGWVSKYAIGGIAVDQRFPEGTKITEVWRQLLEGDPKADNVLCLACVSELPEYWTSNPWRQYTVKRNELVKITSQIPFEWEAIPYNTQFTANNQYIVIALPLSMINEPGTDIVYERPIKLAEIYNTSHPEFSYEWAEYNVKNNPAAAADGYKIYYITNKVTGKFNLSLEFANND